MKLTKRVMYVADAVSVVEPPETVFEKKNSFIEWSFHFPPKYQHTLW